ncbi:hypothetical protein [Saccharopolyspora hattusasensis]|uniref:hypothetical protein n=1 Tax=Saccharopolyspora hattusasensis TaxID=1128679 RepID=UPI003D964DD9
MLIADTPGGQFALCRQADDSTSWQPLARIPVGHTSAALDDASWQGTQAAAHR